MFARNPLTAIACAALAASMTVAGPASAAPIVNFGSLSTITSAADLDTSGNFAYAINYTDVNNESNSYPVGDATFDPGSEAFTGASDTFSNATHDWRTPPDYGSGSDNDNLEQVANAIEFGGNTTDSNELNFTVSTGGRYKLQLYFHNLFRGQRLQEIDVEGSNAVDELDLATFSENGNDDGVLFTYAFTAADDNLDVSIDPDEDASNKPILNGMTLEVIPEPASLALLAPAGLMLLRRRRR